MKLFKKAAWMFLLVPLNTFGFDTNPTLANMAEDSWLKIGDNYYDCGYELCSQILDFSGMVYDHHRHKILMFGGGHATRFWNQVEEFDFNTLTWSKMYAPDMPCDFYSDPANAYMGEDGNSPGGTVSPDGSIKPTSRHTYDGMDMLYDTCLMVMSTAQEGKGGCMSESQWTANTHLRNDRYVWLFDPVETEWDRLTFDAFSYGSGMAVDPATDLVYGKDSHSSALHVYNCKTQNRALVNNRAPIGWEEERPMTYYPGNHSLLLFASDNIYEFEIDKGAWREKNPGGSHQDAKNRNVVYDAKNNVFGFFKGSSFNYYSPTTNRWYSRSGATDPKYDHTIYDPVNNVYIVLTEKPWGGWYTWAYKFSDSPGTFPGTSQGIYVYSKARNLKEEKLSLSITPNPFRQMTKIGCYARKPCKMKICVFNLSGQLIRQLHDSKVEKGLHTVTWDGRNGQGNPVAGGFYMVRFQANEKRSNRLLFLMK